MPSLGFFFFVPDFLAKSGMVDVGAGERVIDAAWNEEDAFIRDKHSSPANRTWLKRLIVKVNGLCVC